MFGHARQGAQAYSAIGMETGVFAASPHQLIVMLFDGAKVALNNAIHALHSGQIQTKGRSISHAIRIISEGLQSSLNKQAGGEIAQNLDALYDYMCRRLVQANAENSEAMITEVLGLLDTIRDAWVQIGPSAQTTPPTVTAPAQPPQGGRLDAQSVHAPAMTKA